MVLTSRILSMPTLLLNKNWLPIRIVSVRKAFQKLFDDKARIVDENYTTYDFQSWADLRVEEGESHVRTAHSKIRIPEVIIVNNYDKVPSGKINCSRANLYKRDQYTCQYCGVKPPIEDLTIEHIVPRSLGGTTTWTNCVLACVRCNTKKANKSLAESGMRLRSKPVKPDWSAKLVLQRVKNSPKSWNKFVSDAYWNVVLEE